MKTLPECIIEAIDKFNHMFDQHGEWNGEEHIKNLNILHQALLECAKNQKENSIE